MSVDWNPNERKSTFLREDGQSLAEIAIVLPLLLVLLAGVFDFGRVVHAHVVVTNASREAALAGAVTFLDESILQGIAAREIARGGVDSGTVSTVISYPTSGLPLRKSIVVDLQYQIPLTLSILPIDYITVRAQSEMTVFWE